MITCDTCGGLDFYTVDGFMYCSECQTQSQKYYEQDINAPGFGTVIKQKPKVKKRAVESLAVCDLWTSWDAFNYILFGMTQELQNLPFSPKGLKETVLKLWAFQLQKSEVAFISKTREKKPKLGILYRHRDSKILYGFSDLIPKRKQKRKRKELRSGYQSINVTKKKLFQKHLEEHSSTQASADYLSDNIYSLTPNSSRSGSVCESERASIGNLRDIFASSEDLTYKKYKELTKTRFLKYSKRKQLNYFCKTKLLATIYLALVLHGSEIQLGDLLRFIREGHLSFAKVTHFLPEEFKLSKGDISFIETIRDQNMPTHLKQRKIGRSLAKSLCVNEIPLADMDALVNRYCVELNLPDIIVRYSLTVLKHLDVEKMCILKRTRYIPNVEAVAMACIIFVMKLLFGLDGVTELILSDLAEKINSLRSTTDKKYFVFNSWQKHIECRKALLQNVHYPTEEKLKTNPIGKSKGFLDHIIKESKDEGKEHRFKKDNPYFLDPKIVNCVKDVLDSLKEPINSDCWDFPPSLTPYSTYLDIIREIHREGNKTDSKHQILSKLPPVTWSILHEEFRGQSIEFILRPEVYKERLANENFRILEKSKSDLIKIKLTSESSVNFGSEMGCEEVVETIKFRQFSKSKQVIFINNPFDYWILKHSSAEENLLYEFKSEVFSKMPINFRWLLVECSQILEMNTRELYKELAFVEARMKVLVRKIRNLRS